jgi:SAM-dependent methyltransferase
MSHLKASPNAIFLDLGCGFGQDMRALAADGVPSAQLVGTDLRREFWELGYQLFDDRGTFKSEFIVADLLSGDDLGPLKALEGKVDVVYAGSLLHLFDYDGQVKVVEKIVSLLKPTEGAVVLGRQVGNTVAGETPRRTADSKRMFRHNEESFAVMWQEVGAKTGTKWKVESGMDEGDKTGSARWDPNFRDLKFAVFRE